MAQNDFTKKAADRLPAIQATLQDAAGAAVDLSGAAVTFAIRQVSADAAVALTGSVTIVSAAAGQVSYAWTAADVALLAADTYYAEWRVTWPGGLVQTFPNDRSLVVRIAETLGA